MVNSSLVAAICSATELLACTTWSNCSMALAFSAILLACSVLAASISWTGSAVFFIWGTMPAPAAMCRADALHDVLLHLVMFLFHPLQLAQHPFELPAFFLGPRLMQPFFRNLFRLMELFAGIDAFAVDLLQGVLQRGLLALSAMAVAPLEQDPDLQLLFGDLGDNGAERQVLFGDELQFVADPVHSGQPHRTPPNQGRNAGGAWEIS